MKSKEVPVMTPSGEGVIESLVVSELNHLMIKVRYEDKWINYNAGKIEELLNLVDMRLKDLQDSYSQVD